MRIGELAAAAGVSTRTVRYYHQVGLLPEPARTASGYRTYALRDLIRLSHARRLVELGLGLDEVRQVLVEEEGRDLGEIVASMDATLALQEERIAAQRCRLADLRARMQDGRLDVGDLPEPDVVEFFTRIEAAGATGPMARLDREVLAFVPESEARRWIAPLLPLLADEAFTRRLVRLYDDFDALADVGPNDPAVTALVDLFFDVMPEESLRELTIEDFAMFGGDAVLDAVYAELAPGQVAAARQLMDRFGQLGQPGQPGQLGQTGQPHTTPQEENA